MNEITSKELALAACKALADKRGKDIVTLYVREKTSLCDYFVLASGSNSSQIRAMGERVEELISREYGIDPTRTEGVRDGRWAVVDYGDVIVHIFNDDIGNFDFRRSKAQHFDINIKMSEFKSVGRIITCGVVNFHIFDTHRTVKNINET